MGIFCHAIQDLVRFELLLRLWNGKSLAVPFSLIQDTYTSTQVSTEAGVPVLPQGLTPEIAEQMLIELQKQTFMTVQYAKDCLEQVQWDFDRALQAFAAVRANLPADAFVQAA